MSQINKKCDMAVNLSNSIGIMACGALKKVHKSVTQKNWNMAVF